MKKHSEYRIAHSEYDYDVVYNVRKAVYGNQMGYPKHLLEVEKDKTHIHMLREKDNIPIGAITAGFEDLKTKKLGIESIVNISEYKGDKNIELTRLAVINPKIYIHTALNLIGSMYEYIKRLGMTDIFIPTPKIDYNVSLYKKFGYEIIKEANFHNVFDIYIMYLNINDYETNPRNKKIIEFARKRYYKLGNY